MSMKLAVDCGHGYVKALSTTGQRILFPSLICPPPGCVDLGEFGTSEMVRMDDQPYLVGEAAVGHATPLWSRDKAGDPDTLRLILMATAKLGAMGPVQLATGLPLSWFGSQHQTLTSALMGYGATIQLPAQPARRLWIENVKVYPQGVAAASVLIAASDREPGDYIVVDVGYRTADYVVVTKGPKIRMDPTQAGSLEIGTHAIAAELADGLEHDYGIPFTAAEVETAHRVHVDGVAVELAQRRRAAAALTSQRLKESLTEKLDEKLSKVAGIVLCGGGATVLAGAFPHAILPEQPQWANVQAYLGRG